MGDPLSVAAGVAGLLSLGIQVSQSLIDYYTSVQGQDVDVDRTLRRLKGLVDTFSSLKTALDKRTFYAEDQALVENVERSIQECKDLISELEDELQKCTQDSAPGVRARIKTAGRRAAYPFRKSTLQTLDEDIDDIRENLSLALEALHLNDSSRIEKDVDEIKGLLNVVTANQISKAICDWLKAPDAIIDHSRACEKRHALSGLWLLRSDEFTRWLIRTNSFLWLYGFAGCGKSVLCSTTIQHIFQHRRSNTRVGIAFFYFTFNDASKQAASSMIRSLLLQLSKQTGNNGLNNLYEMYRDNTPPDTELMKTLRGVIREFHDVYCVIDALDESPQGVKRNRVLDVLAETRNWSLSGLHILVTSRDLTDIRGRVQDYGDNVSMDNEEVDKDIACFISGYLQESPALQKWSAHRDLIRDGLTSRAKGVFRWVDCQFASIAECPRSIARLKKLLRSLPRSLDETYERILCNINPDSADDVKRILNVICVSKRPMRVREVIDSVAVRIDSTLEFEKEYRFEGEEDILSICGGLVAVGFGDCRDAADKLYRGNPSETSELDRTVRIAHFSVQEYLESDRIKQQNSADFAVKRNVAHTEFTQVCLVYLIDPALSASVLDKSIFEERQFVKYAAHYWFLHYQESDITSKTQDLLMEFFDEQKESFCNWVRIFDPEQACIEMRVERKRDEIASPLYYTSLLGLTSALSQYLEGMASSRNVNQLSKPFNLYTEVNAQGGEYGNALQAASWRGHEQVIRLLLEKGAEVNAQGGHYGSALQAASWRGHEQVIRLLLDKGAEVNSRSYRFGTALQTALNKGYDQIAYALLDKGAEVNALDDKYGNVLDLASSRGYEPMVQILLDKGAKVKAQDRE